MSNILSIQSLVAYGHAGNSAALFPLQRMGMQVWPVMTVHFSNHTGYGDWKGPLLTSGDVADVIAGVDARGALARCDAVLSGYQGAEDVGSVILDAVTRVKSLNPSAIYCCDPVMGDVDRGMFVRPGIPEFMRDRVLPAADVLTPNHFELDFLAGTESRTRAELLAAVAKVREAGPATVLVTSVLLDDTPPGTLEMVAAGSAGVWSARFPRLSVNPPGAGDLTAAVFLANLLNGHDLPTALSRTASSVFAVVEATEASGDRELRIVQTQDALADPPARFAAAPLG
jgi:pyridoxine kinase